MRAAAFSFAISGTFVAAALSGPTGAHSNGSGPIPLAIAVLWVRISTRIWARYRCELAESRYFSGNGGNHRDRIEAVEAR